MPRLSKSVPKYRKHKASGQAFVELNAKRIYLGPHGTKTSKTEYDRLIGEWLANGRQLPNPATDRPVTVNQLAAAYWRFAKGYYVKNGKPTDEQAGIKSALRYVKQSYGRKPVTEFGPLALEAIRVQMITNDLSRRYINQLIGRIKRMFRWGVAKQMIPVEIYQSLATVDGLKKGRCKARERDPVLPVNDSTIKATVEHLPQTLADMIWFQRWTGCRPGEVVSIRPRDVERTNEIVAEYGVWLYWPQRHKMEHKERHRVVGIGPKAQAILTPYLLRAADDHCFKRKHGRGAFTVRSYQSYIARACNAAEVDHWAPNQLRHSAATEIRSRDGIEASQLILGHSKPDTSLIYAERDLKKIGRIASEVG